jgi:hypothetical protein
MRHVSLTIFGCAWDRSRRSLRLHMWLPGALPAYYRLNSSSLRWSRCLRHDGEGKW